MKRRLLNLLTALSLLLCGAVGALWVRSHFAEDQGAWTTSATRRLGFVSSLGRVKVWHGTILRPGAASYGPAGGWFSSDRASRELQPDVPGDAITGWNPLGLGAWSRVHGQQRYYSRGILIPYWLLLAMFALPPAWWLWRRPVRRARRARSGLCPSCGYDLRATPDRCPECGGAGSVSTSV
jgi:hypothetical protein